MITNVEFYEHCSKMEEKLKNHHDFYELAEKYGFCTPWCIEREFCQSCEKKE